MIPGFPEPKRQALHVHPGLWSVTVTPPMWSGFEEPQTVTLTEDQYRRYCDWLAHGTLIQDALPELSAADREILMTGVGPDEWDAEFPDDEPE